jgi:thioredoxin 1
MEIDPNPQTVKKYQVEGVPALRLVKDGQLVASTEGVLGKEKLLNVLDEHLQKI